MKNRNLLIALCTSIAILFTLYSCNDNELDTGTIDLNPENVFKNSIGTLTDDGNFQRMDRIDVNSLIKSDMNFNFSKENIEFYDFQIEEGLDKKKNKTYYLVSKSTDKSASVSIKLKKDVNGNLILAKDGCKCESTDCQFGCNASGAGETCQCSSCFQTCKKTSTSEQIARY